MFQVFSHSFGYHLLPSRTDQITFQHFHRISGDKLLIKLEKSAYAQEGNAGEWHLFHIGWLLLKKLFSFTECEGLWTYLAQKQTSLLHNKRQDKMPWRISMSVGSYAWFLKKNCFCEGFCQNQLIPMKFYFQSIYSVSIPFHHSAFNPEGRRST